MLSHLLRLTLTPHYGQIPSSISTNQAEQILQAHNTSGTMVHGKIRRLVQTKRVMELMHITGMMQNRYPTTAGAFNMPAF